MTRQQRQGGGGFDIGDYVDVAERIAEFRTKHPEGSLQPYDPVHPYRIETIGPDTFIVYTAAAYRTPDDTRPGIGVAQEGYPGRTPYTRGSEVQNAETSAWGRAIVAALAADTRRGVASAQEVRNRQAERDTDRPVQVIVPAAELVARASKAITEAKAIEDLEKISRRLNHLAETGQIPGDAAERLHAAVKDRYNALAEPASGLSTDQQRTRIHTMFAKAGVTDRAEKLSFCSDVIGREITTTNELSADEADKVIAALREAERVKRAAVHA